MTPLDIATGLALLFAVFLIIGLQIAVVRLDVRRRAHRRFTARRVADALKQIDPRPSAKVITLNHRRKST